MPKVVSGFSAVQKMSGIDDRFYNRLQVGALTKVVSGFNAVQKWCGTYDRFYNRLQMGALLLHRYIDVF